MARVICLTLRDADMMHGNLFKVFNPAKDVHRKCTELFAKKILDVKSWLLNSIFKI